MHPTEKSPPRRNDQARELELPDEGLKFFQRTVFPQQEGIQRRYIGSDLIPGDADALGEGVDTHTQEGDSPSRRDSFLLRQRDTKQPAQMNEAVQILGVKHRDSQRCVQHQICGTFQTNEGGRGE